MSVIDRLKKKQEKRKDANYISFSESAKITKQNRKITMAMEKERNRKNVPEEEYITAMKDPDNVVEFDDVHTYFFTSVGTVKAVNGVSFNVPRGKTVGVVGESGCGKSVTSLSLMQLVQRPSGQTVSGEIRFNDGNKVYNVVKTPTKIMEKLRGNKMSMIFQEPMTSLNPVFKIGDQLEEVLELHDNIYTKEEERARRKAKRAFLSSLSTVSKEEQQKALETHALEFECNKERNKRRAIELLELVGIANSKGVYKMYPHELSGGMRQRVMIAMALACNPNLIIADEPTTALDVTIQAQILELLRNIKDKLGTSIMLITHDLGVIAEMADYVVVMYSGKVVEKGTAEDIFDNPCHPYTLGLMHSKPVVGVKVDRLYNIPGNVPNPVNMPDYCYFRDRCDYRCDKCNGQYPELVEVSEGHFVACYRDFKEAEPAVSKEEAADASAPVEADLNSENVGDATPAKEGNDE